MPDQAPASRDAPRPGSLKTALANMGWLLGSRGVAAVLSLVYIAIITRTLGLAGFGQFTLIVGIGQTITALVGFQTWQIIVRYGVSHLHERRTAALARLVKACLALDLIGALVGSLLAFAAIDLLAPRFGWSEELQRYAFFICLAALIAVRSTSIGVLRLHSRFGVAAVADAAIPITRLIGALVAYALAPRLESFLIAWLAADLVAGLAYWSFALGSLRALPFRRNRLNLADLRKENDGIVRLAAITNASQTLALTSRQGAVLLVGLFASPTAAGGFRLAHQLGQALAKVGQLLSRALFPELVRARTLSSDPEHFHSLLWRTVRLTAMGGAAILVLLLLAGRTLLGLIAGEEFLHVYPVLLMLGTAAVIDLVGVAFEPALIASGRAGVAFRLQLVVATVLVGLLVVLPSQYGAIGGGIALLTASILSFLLLGLAAIRTLRRHDPEVRPTDQFLVEGSAADTDRPEALG